MWENILTVWRKYCRFLPKKCLIRVGMEAENLNTHNLLYGGNICIKTAGICTYHSTPILEPQKSNKSSTEMIPRSIHFIEKSQK